MISKIACTPVGGNVKVSVEKLPTSEAVLEVDLTWDELEKASDKAYRKLVQKVDVQGFRRGKAPRSLLERKLGKEYIYQEGLDDLISETYRNAVKEHELVPLAKPEVEAPVFEIGQPYHFSLKVPVITPVELGDYSSLHFEREEADVTSEEVEQELESLRNRQATWHEVERPADYGDRVTVDLKLTIEDKTISDLKDNPFELTQERHGLFTGMDEHIVGMQVGESKEFTTTLPTDYTNQDLAGKEAHYAVTLYKIEVKEVPELDDELAKQVSNSQNETLEDLRKAISDNILENKKRRINDELREKVVNAVIEQAQITIHPLLIQEEAEEMLHQLSHLLEQQHMSLDQYLMMVRKTREEYLKEIQPEAEKRVKRELVLDAVAKKENIEVLPEELEGLLRLYVQAGQEVSSEAQMRALAVTYRREKAIKRLLELTTDPDPDAESVTGENEESSIANAEGAALAGEPVLTDTTNTTGTQAEVVEIGEPEVSPAPAAGETIGDVVE
ncbi:MAG: trigger factor [Chloroflexi bacterium]|nr:MAG: trigger factor [Chloroflexota bacterium]